MNDRKLNDNHEHFAKLTFNKTWDLIEKNNRTVEDNDDMLAAAYASLYHWSYAGTALHLQRGHWLISRVHTILGNSSSAVYHASRCLEITESNQDLMQDFDVAFAYESVARAHSLSGNPEEAQKHIEKALSSGEDIKKSSDREYFYKDFQGNTWGEVRPETV